MNEKLSCSNIIDALKEKFPEFTGYDHLKDNKIVYFSFFVDFIIKHFKNETLVRKAAEFINLMSESDDEDLDGILDDFLINMYSMSKERKLDITRFLEGLSDESMAIYTTNIRLWSRRKE